MTRVEFNGEVRYLLYSVGVMMDVNKKYGALDALLDLLGIDPITPECFAAFAWTFARMVNEGEMKIDQDGFHALDLITEEDVYSATTMTIIEHARLTQAVIDEISLAYKHEYTDEEKQEIDIGLAEIRKKKESPEKPQMRTIITSD